MLVLRGCFLFLWKSGESSKVDQKRRLERLQAELIQQELPVELPDKPERPPSEEERRALVEQRIQEAMKDGHFDDLPGKGKPLIFDDNPYLEPGQDLAFSLLRNNDFAPEWIERDKEIRRELKTVRKRLRLAWQNSLTERARQRALERFADSLEKLNRKIDDFNLIVPIISCQRPRLRLEDEISGLQQEVAEETNRTE